jgi:putative OPT family oligopeptide transporter
MSQHENETAAAHKPYVPDEQVIPEFTWSAVIVGAVLGIVFGASSLYLVLKVGMTISASIPVAVLSITLFRVFTKIRFRFWKWTIGPFRRATILENNIVQTTGSAGESIAFGVGVTMPAVMILGFEMEIARVMVVSVLGGILGILMMIPLRRAFIVKQHGTLKYPEGTACADVLIIGETGGATAKTVFLGFGLAFVYKFLMGAMKLWKDVVSRPLDWFQGATPALEADPALLGVGYIIGTKISSIMVAGGILSYFVFVPAIHFFGDKLTEPLFPATKTIASMDADEIRSAYVLYIGAGAVATGGIISLFRALPLIFSSLVSGLRDMRASMAQGADRKIAKRTERDMPMSFVLFGSLVLVVLVWLFLGLAPESREYLTMSKFFVTNLIASLLIVLFGFLFVTVSSRLTGEIGSSSNPISGMTVATLLLTCLIFWFAGWTSFPDRLIVISIAAVVCIASSNGGTTSQDLKTGYLVGATPKFQQWSILVGSISSALVIGVILIALNQLNTVHTRKNLPVLKMPVAVSELHRREISPLDGREYFVWQAVEGNSQGVPQGKYYVNDKGNEIIELVDPGINGSIKNRDNGIAVSKFNPPQARLFALITDGILNHKLPWTLVLLGVFIAVVMELCGMPSLPFAVGVYLPLSSSAPIFVGGLVRFVVDKFRKKSAGEPAGDEASDMSPGVLFSTGYIAGGAIAGVIIAFFTFSDRLTSFLGGLIAVPQYDSISLSAFGALAVILTAVGLGWILKAKDGSSNV